ncbi:MAG: hypothetical protein L6W00_30470 [Lentisphaeria bacterium]|nr:MAG: hypothetical protein L6W00_30470 [Lentisphaeria bacterium]
MNKSLFLYALLATASSLMGGEVLYHLTDQTSSQLREYGGAKVEKLADGVLRVMKSGTKSKWGGLTGSFMLPKEAAGKKLVFSFKLKCINIQMTNGNRSGNLSFQNFFRKNREFVMKKNEFMSRYSSVLSNRQK